MNGKKNKQMVSELLTAPHLTLRDME